MNFHSAEELQEYFEAAIALVYEAFPKQRNGGTLADKWGACAAYISHAAHLSYQFANNNKSNVAIQLLRG